MKLSFALVVPMTTAVSMAAAVEDATATAVNQKYGHQKHLHLHPDQNPDASTQVQESLQGLEEATTAAVKSDLLFIKELSSSMGSRTTIGSGSGDGVTGDVEMDVGLLPIRERRLNSGGEDCNDCDSRPKIEVSGTDFRELVKNCYNGGDTCPTEYNVPIRCWNTSKVMDMQSAFYEIELFDDSINCWNTARVTEMFAMFYKATNFNQPLDDWNVASVNDMAFMFSGASNFNQPLDDWNVASVYSMVSMLKGATNFNQPLNDWDVGGVNNMNTMFYDATNFNQSINDWNVASVTDMNNMFGGENSTKFNQCLSSWADKTPINVSVIDIFGDSGCPNKDPVANVGPWCQGKDDNCFAPQAPGGTSSLTNLLSAPKQKKTSKKNNKN